jgi:hypothetical protein
MANEARSDLCFLCGSSSIFYEFDGSKRRHYRCTGATCGEYVITDTARRRLDVPHACNWRKDAAALARRTSDEARILEIWVNPDTHMLETHIVARKGDEAGA